MRIMSHLGKTPVWNTAEPAGGAPAADPAPAEPATAEPASQADPAPDLSFIPKDYHVDGKPDLGKFTEHYQATIAELAQMKEARTGIPESPDAYQFALPDDLDLGEMELPEGYEFKLDDKDPALGEMRAWLHANGVKPEAVSGLMGVYAKMQAREAAAHMEAMKSHIAELGGQDAFNARMATLGNSLKTKVGEELASELMGVTYTAKAVRALEKLLGPGSGQSPRSEPAKASIDPTLPASTRLRMLREAG